MQTKIRGIDRVSGNEVDIFASSQHDLDVSQLLPPYAKLTLRDMGMIVQATTAVASVTADPTTASLGTLYNGEAGGGKVYIIDQVFFDTSASDEDKYGDHHLVYCVQQIGTTSTIVADVTIKKRMGGNYGGLAKFDVGHTAVDEGWFPLGDSIPTRASNHAGGMARCVNVAGRIILKPTAALALSVVGNDVDVTVMVGVAWYEIDVDYV